MRLIMAILLSIFTLSGTVARAEAPSVLLVVSSHGTTGETPRPGFEMDELSQAWLVFRANGFVVDIASPKGGAVIADKYNPAKLYNAAFLADPAAKKSLAATLSTAAAGKREYAAVFVVGGKGPMFDLAGDLSLHQLIARTWQGGGVIGAVCHGPAALVGVRLNDGSLLLAGREATGFSGEEEELFGKKWSKQFAFQLEEEMRRVGARFTEADMMLPHVAVDGRLVTGQNPLSTAKASEAVVRATGREPVARQPWADERSLELIAALSPEKLGGARLKVAADPANFDFPVIGMWGHFRTLSAGEDRAGIARGLMAMELAAPHFAEPKLTESIAAARAKLASTAKKAAISAE